MNQTMEYRPGTSIDFENVDKTLSTTCYEQVKMVQRTYF